MEDPKSQSDCELVSARLIPVDRTRVFRALTEAEYLAEWWGPKGFYTEFHQFDPSPGGEWRFEMVGPDGKSYENRSVFETVEPGRVVIEHLEPVHWFRLTITLDSQADGTLLIWRMVFENEAECEKAREYIPDCNEECFDRLEKTLAKISGPDSDERDLVLTRIFDAPREKVFRAWAEPDLLKQWFAPAPLTTPVAELDVRPGGSNFIVMRTEDGSEMPMKGVYLEVIENQRIVATDAYCTAWELSEKPFMTMVLTFGELGENRTRYTATVHHWTVEDRKQHEEMGFYEGWGKCADQLAALVEMG